MPETSTLTFLFTDIEGSTSKWEEHPEEMAQAVGRHDALLRDAVVGHGGLHVIAVHRSRPTIFPPRYSALNAATSI